MLGGQTDTRRQRVTAQQHSQDITLYFQCAVFSVRSAVFSVPCSVLGVQYSVFSVQCAVFSVQCLVCSVQCAAFCAQCLVCSVQWCAVCSVQCALCSVQCAVCTVQCAGPITARWFVIEREIWLLVQCLLLLLLLLQHRKLHCCSNNQATEGSQCRQYIEGNGVIQKTQEIYRS